MITRLHPLTGHARALGRCSHCGSERDYPVESFRRVQSCGCLRKTNAKPWGHSGKPAARPKRDRKEAVDIWYRIPARRRSDREVIGALFLSGYDGAPLLLAAFAKRIGETVEDLELRGSILGRWLQMVISERGPVILGKRIPYSELRTFLDAQAIGVEQQPVWLEEAA